MRMVFLLKFTLKTLRKIMTIKFLFTKEEVEQMKAEQNLTDKINNFRAQKRRNDAEDRAAAKAEAKND